MHSDNKRRTLAMLSRVKAAIDRFFLREESIGIVILMLGAAVVSTIVMLEYGII